MKPVSPRKQSIRALLGMLLSVFNVGLPVFAVLYLTQSKGTASFFSEWELGFLASTFFLAAIFIGLMQILFAKYWPKTIGGLLEVILLPFVFMAVKMLFVPLSVVWYLVDVGLLYLLQLMLGFTILVWGGAFLSGEWKSFHLRDWWHWFLICSAQLLFLVPGWGAVFILGRFVWFEQLLVEFPDALLWSFPVLGTLLLYLLPALISTRVVYAQMKGQSIYAH